MGSVNHHNKATGIVANVTTNTAVCVAAPINRQFSKHKNEMNSLHKHFLFFNLYIVAYELQSLAIQKYPEQISNL
jgi:hypothetical protein